METKNYISILFLILKITGRESMTGKEQNNEKAKAKFDDLQPLFDFQKLLSESFNTEFLILMDVGSKSKSFLDDLKNISKGAVKCLYKLSQMNNTAAIMTFATKPKLQVNFCDDCYKDKNFIAKTEKNIQTADEKRYLTRALKKAMKMLKKRSQTNINEKRNQTILLITFGVDEATKYLQMDEADKLSTLGKLGDKFIDNNINLAVAGVGQESLDHRDELHKLVEKQPEKYFAIMEKDDILDILELLIGYSCIQYNG